MFDVVRIITSKQQFLSVRSSPDPCSSLLLTTIVEHNCVYFSPTLRINVFSY